MVVWLKSSLVLLFLMTETNKELNEQTVKIIDGQEVVLGKGFEDRTDNFASDVPPDKNFLEASRDYFLEKYYDVKGFVEKEIEDYKFEQQEPQFIETIPTPKSAESDILNNPLYQYHLTNLKEENIIDGDLTTVYIKGITNPEDGKIYNVPGFVDGKKIDDEQKLLDIAKERNWFETYRGYETGQQANEAISVIYPKIQEDGKKFLESLEPMIKPKKKPEEIKFIYDADLIARMIVTEAFDYDFSNPESKALAEAEMLAMANVVVNRANMKTGFSVGKGKTRIEKLIRSGDFKGVTEFEDRFNNPEKEYKEKYQLAFNIARNLLAGRLEDNTNGALYFNQDPKSKGFKHGKHYFYVEPYEEKKQSLIDKLFN